MKQKESEPSQQGSLRTLILFCVIVALVLLVSLCYRIILLVKDSKFDGESGFIVALIRDDKKQATIYAFDPTGGTVATVHVTSRTSLANLEQQMAVPFDAVLQRKNLPGNQSFPLEFTSYSLYNPTERTDISLLDALRLWWEFRGVPERDRHETTITLPAEMQDIDTKLAAVFTDTKLENEKQTIAIVNGTVITGLGGRLEQLIDRIGGSVISITTAHQTVPHSRIIYYGNKTYTVERLSRILSYPIVDGEGSNVSDIVIEIGNDEQRTMKY